MFEDTYKTIATVSEGIYKEKGSKFLAFAVPVENEAEVKEKVAFYKKQYHDARHHCYAYILGYNKDAYRQNDDGEPSGTAGRPIHGQLLSKDVTNVLLVVVRYFGGIKLGVSGLITAYKTAAKDALENAQIIEKIVQEPYTISFDYQYLNSVMQILKDESVQILSQGYENNCVVNFKVRKRDADRFITMLKKIEGLQVTCL